MREMLRHGVGCLLALGVLPAAAAARDLVYTPVAPCRVIDTRVPNQPIVPGVTRTFAVAGTGPAFAAQGGNSSGCGIPGRTTDGGDEHNEVAAVALNLIAVGPTGPGHLLAWAANQPTPEASVINYASVAETGGLNIANGIILPLCDQLAANPCAGGDLSFAAGVSSVHLIADVLGYFATPGRPSSHRYGTGSGFDNGLCTGPTGLRFGLSATPATWGGAGAACPRGTWVCSLAERGTSACVAARPADGCEIRYCNGTCFDVGTNPEAGWLADVASGGLNGLAVPVSGGVVSLANCISSPVWCCSR